MIIHINERHLLMFVNSSFINLVLLSLFFICSSFMVFSFLAIKVFSGIENIMTATPGSIAGPMSSYNETNASIICPQYCQQLLSIANSSMKPHLEWTRYRNEPIRAEVLQTSCINRHQVHNLASRTVRAFVIRQDESFTVDCSN